MWAEPALAERPPTADAPTTVETVAIPVDGAQLATDVLRPQRPGAYPTLLVRTPYGRRALHDALAVLDPLEAPRRGWALVLQDVRGSGASSGRFSFLADDGADGAATIAWIAAQPWSDGRVAMAGRSYPGRVQELAATARPPGLVAIAPEACGSSRDSWHPGGVLKLGIAAGWIARLARDADADADADASDALALVRRVVDPEDPLARACAALRPGLLDRDAPAWERVEPSAEALAELPCLRSTGWYDAMLAPTLARHRASQALGAGGAHKLVVGPWGHDALDGRYAGVDHGPEASAAALGLGRLRERFYAAALAGRPAEEIPNVHVFVTGDNTWRTFDAWPPPTRERTWFLAPAAREDGSRTLRDAPAVDGSVARFLGDPRDPVPDLGVERDDVGPVDRRTLGLRRDVLLYRSAPLERELELAGSACVELLVESDARDFDLMVRLWDAHPDGRELHVADGVANRAACGAIDRASGLVALLVPLSPCHHVLRPGHALVLTIQSSDHPRYVPNPQTGRRLADGPPYDVHVAAHAIHEGQATPSRLVLPCVA